MASKWAWVAAAWANAGMSSRAMNCTRSSIAARTSPWRGATYVAPCGLRPDPPIQTCSVRHLPAIAGRWRTEQVWIGGSGRSPHGATYVAPRHGLVRAAMDDLVQFMARDDMPALAQAAATHAHFEAIHPLPAGNGRAGRALLHAQLRHR